MISLVVAEYSTTSTMVERKSKRRFLRLSIAALFICVVCYLTTSKSLHWGGEHLFGTKRLSYNYSELSFITKMFNMTRPDYVDDINVLLIVSSAPIRNERRNAIRDSWWKQCKSLKQITIKCLFFTDTRDNTTSEGRIVEEEIAKYGDVRYQNLSGGYDFGKRFLYHMVWASLNYNFDYFIRMDDDYFLCLEKLLLELPMPPRKLYHWGFVHCIKNLVRPDESIVLFSRDVVQTFLRQRPDSFLCHKWAGQMIGIWSHELRLPKFYRHDARLHHHPPAQNLKGFHTLTDVCHKYIGIHGSYPALMRTLWKNRGNGSGYTKGTTLDDNSNLCRFESYMDWQLFGVHFKSKPELCQKAKWSRKISKAYIGREGHL